MRSCEVYVHGLKAGILTERNRNLYEFEYDKEYLKGENPQAVSLTLPLTSEIYRSPYLFPTFSNMLSEGENRNIQSILLHIDPDDDFGFLLNTCEYDTIGAVTIKKIND